MFKGSRRGLTLIELIIVLGIVAILITIGKEILDSQYDSIKSKEAVVMLEGIAKQIKTETLMANFDTTLSPDASPTSKKRPLGGPMLVGPHEVETSDSIRCSYGAYYGGGTALYLVALCDIDGDGAARALIRTVILPGPKGAHQCDGMAGFKLDTKSYSKAGDVVAATGIQSEGTGCGYTTGALDAMRVF